MLPSYKSLNELFGKATQRFLHRASNRDGILRELRGYIIHEGRNTSIRRPDDSIDETEMVTAEASITLSFDEIDNIDVGIIFQRLISMADQFGNQRAEYVFKTLSEVTEKTGQTHDARGKPLTNEDMFAMIEKMRIDFEKNKTVGDFSIVAPPQMIPIFRRLEREMDESPAPQERWKELMERKKNEYREREIDRNLVG